MTDLHPQTIFQENSRDLHDESYALDINDVAQTVISRDTTDSIETAIAVAYKNVDAWSFVTIEEAFDNSARMDSGDLFATINNSSNISFSFILSTSQSEQYPIGTSVSYINNAWHRTDITTDNENDIIIVQGSNDLGQITGYIHNTSNPIPFRPFIATPNDNGMELTIINGDGIAEDINRLGIVVGKTITGEAFIYTDGQMHNLSDLVSNGLEGWTSLKDATSINSSGQVVGYGIYNGKKMAYLLTPAEEDVAICEIGLTPQSIKKGEGTALWWWSRDITSATINNDIGNVELPTHYKWISPTQTTMYTMSATGSDGTIRQCSTKVIVEGVCEMGVDPQVISKGEGTALWWWTDGISRFEITSPTDQKFQHQGSEPTAYKWFYPQETATYKMIAKTADGTPTACETTIVVE